MERLSSKQKVTAHRAKRRAQGLRLVQFWLPDVGSVVFKAEAHQQSMLVAMSADAVDEQAYIDVISDWSAE